MPLYRYECSCGHVVEKLQRMPGQKTVRCPECRRRARRVMSAPGAIIFKGQRA